MHLDTPRHSPWSEECGCELSPGCEVHRAAADLGAALQAAVIALSARMPLTDSEPAHYFAHDSIGREIAAALHKAGLLLLELPSSKMAVQPRYEPASEFGRAWT
jgi:hypothetical protein